MLLSDGSARHVSSVLQLESRLRRGTDHIQVSMWPPKIAIGAPTHSAVRAMRFNMSKQLMLCLGVEWCFDGLFASCAQPSAGTSRQHMNGWTNKLRQKTDPPCKSEPVLSHRQHPFRTSLISSKPWLTVTRARARPPVVFLMNEFATVQPN